MNNPSAENNRWKLSKLLEANIQSYAGMGVRISKFSVNYRMTLKVKVKCDHM